MKKKNREVRAYLNDLADAFHRRFVGNKGWGQFLDGSIANTQVGLYGTSAGAVVLHAAQRIEDALAKTVAATLLDYSTAGTADAEMKRSQTLRLAMLFLGMAAIPSDSDKHATGIYARFLDSRIAGANMWGDYWLDGAHHSGEPKVFVTAFVLVCLRILNQTRDAEADLRGVATALQATYLSDPDRHVPYEPIVFAGLILTLGQSVDGRLKKRMCDSARRELRIGERFRYYYDFRDTAGIDRRDYFIIPIQLATAFVMTSVHVPGSYVLRGVQVAERLMSELQRTGEFYKPERSDRVSTLEQAFAALALKAYEEFKTSKRQLTFAAAYYGLVRHRDRGEWALNLALLLAYSLILVAVILPVLDKSGAVIPPWLQATLITVLAAIKNPKDLAQEVLRKSK